MDDEETLLEVYVAKRQRLRNSRGKAYSELVRNFKEFEWLEKAERQSRVRDGPDLSGDMPRDDAGQAVLVDRLGNAIANLQGIESRTTRKNSSKRGDVRFVDSAGVKCVKDKSKDEIAMLAWKFMVSVPIQLVTFFLLLVVSTES